MIISILKNTLRRLEKIKGEFFNLAQIYEEERYYEEDNHETDLVDLIFILLECWKVIVLIMIPKIILGFRFAITSNYQRMKQIQL